MEAVFAEPYVPPALQWALQMVTGGGKTEAVIEEIARFLKQYGRKHTPLIYAVPMHSLEQRDRRAFQEAWCRCAHLSRLSRR